MVKPPDETLRELALDDLDLRFADLRLPCPQAIARLREDVEREGLRTPLLVSDHVEEGKWVLIDGFKRLQVVRELSTPRVAVRVVHLAVVPAQVAIVAANPTHRGLSDFEAGLIIHRLHRAHALTQAQIADLMGRHKTWVCRRLSLVERLDARLQEDLRLGLTSAATARQLALLPRGNQVLAARTIATHRLSTRQAAQLVGALRVAAPAEQKQLLEQPLCHLPETVAPPPAPVDPRLGIAGNRLRETLVRLGAAAHRVIESLRQRSPDAFGRVERRLLGELAARLAPSAREAMAGIERLVSLGEEKTHAEARTPTDAGV